MEAKPLEENGEMDEVPEVLTQYGRHRRSASLLRAGLDCELKVGVPWPVTEFVQMALELNRPSCHPHWHQLSIALGLCSTS